MSGEFQPVWVAGFMSGTSIDAVDAASLLTDGETIFEFGPVFEYEYTASERQILRDTTDAARNWGWRGDPPAEAFARARQTVVETHLKAWQGLVECHSAKGIGAVSKSLPAYLGVHGQTVLHRPPQAGRAGATLQLMDGPALAKATGVPIVHDFRSHDVSQGGQGAPLAPAYHAALLQKLSGEPAAVLNLGGVANVTARLSDGTLIAFDTGPANGPIDEWVVGHDRGLQDIDGRFAAAGHVHEGLLAQLLEHPWFSDAPPKSLDRYDFNASMARGLPFNDGAATLTAFSARAVAVGLSLLPEKPERLIVCGGGRHNPVLMQKLAESVPCSVQTAETVGWRGDSIEAEAFAFLAARSLRGLPISWPSTTGGPQPLTGGTVSNPV